MEQAGQAIPKRVKGAARLTDYAVEPRYPGLFEPVTHEEYEEAVVVAEEVVSWVRQVIEQGTKGK